MINGGNRIRTKGNIIYPFDMEIADGEFPLRVHLRVFPQRLQVVVKGHMAIGLK